MTPFVVLACGQQKRTQPAPALDLYTGPYFAATRRWALSVTDRRRIFVLSALHGLIPADRVIKPYDRRLHCSDVDDLAERVERQAEALIEPETCTVPVWFCGGAEYARLLAAAGVGARAVSDAMPTGRAWRGLGAQRAWFAENLGRLPRWLVPVQVREQGGGVAELLVRADSLGVPDRLAAEKGRPLPGWRLRHGEIPEGAAELLRVPPPEF